LQFKKGTAIKLRPLMPDALPVLYLSDAINPPGIFQARLTQSCGFPALSESRMNQATIESVLPSLGIFG
jgi:hypothetical protein